MAKLDPNTLIGIIQGKLGDLVFVRAKDGTVHVRRRPVREAPFTASELGSQSRLARANDYVQKLKSNPDAYAAYKAAAKLRGKRACDLAKADFAHPPTIQDIDLSKYTGQPGQPVWVQAVDDFEVQGVHLTSAQLDEVLIETGPAVLEPESTSWRYLTQAAVPPGQPIVIHVTACDRPGNEVSKSFHQSLVAAA